MEFITQGKIMKIKNCKKCGGDEFIIQEIILHEAALCPKEKELTVYKEQECEIQRIFCKNCDADYSEDNFKVINFR